MSLIKVIWKTVKLFFFFLEKFTTFLKTSLVENDEITSVESKVPEKLKHNFGLAIAWLEMNHMKLSTDKCYLICHLFFAELTVLSINNACKDQNFISYFGSINLEINPNLGSFRIAS